jgi:hypothetical protein
MGYFILLSGLLSFVDLCSMTYKMDGDYLIDEVSRINNSPISDHKLKHSLKLSLQGLWCNELAQLLPCLILCSKAWGVKSTL